MKTLTQHNAPITSTPTNKQVNNISKAAFMKPIADLSLTLANFNLAPYEVIEILDVKLTQEINEHGSMYVKALLSDEQGEKYATESASGKNLTLSANGSVLFQGIVGHLNVGSENGSYYMEIQGISYSHLLDLKPQSRSFQDASMTYQAVASQVMSSYGGSVMDLVANGASINQFIMQYLETDWQFLKRLASHFNAGIVCDSRFDKPMIYLGTSHIQRTELENFNYIVKKDMSRYRVLTENGVKGLIEDDFLTYEVQTNQVLNVGDEVRIQGRTLYVLEVVGSIIRDVFVNKLTLSTKKGLCQPYKAHDEVAGCSFNGKVIDVKNDQVKVHLDIDKEQSGSTARWFPYSTLFSSDKGSGWYCMPELGDTIRLYVPDGSDDHAYAISSVHEPVKPQPGQNAQGKNNGLITSSTQGAGGSAPAQGGISAGGMRDNPEEKSLRNEAGHELRLTPDGLYAIIDGSVIALKVEDGVLIQSEKDIEIVSEKSVMIVAEEEINIVGTEGVKLCAETAEVLLEEDVNIKGQEVKSNGGA